MTEADPTAPLGDPMAEPSTVTARQRTWTLIVVCLGVTVITMDNTILNVALPSIVRELGARSSELEWVVDAYVLMFACLLLTMGALGDKFGRKGALSAGLVIFATFSGVSAFSGSPEVLIVGRALQGLGAALIFPSTLSILTNTFTGHDRAKAIGTWAGVAAAGAAIGPILGGVLLEHFWWGSVLLINVPWCAALLVLGHHYIPDSRDPENRALDPLAALLSILALAGVLYAIIQAPDAGWTAPKVVIPFAIGALLIVAFAKWELHTPQPMLDLRVFRNPRFSAASLTLTLVSFAAVGSSFLLTQYFQFVLGYSPLKTGAMFIPLAIGMMMGAPNAHRLVSRWGTKAVVATGTGIVSAMLAAYASNAIMSNYAGGMLVRFTFGVGIGITYAPATESIMSSIPLANAGVGSAVNDTSRQTGGALGVAVLGSLFVAQYRRVISFPASVSTAAATTARNSIGRALEAASHLPGAQGATLAHVARDAFVSAMQVTYPIGAVAVLGGTAVVLRYLPANASAAGHQRMLDRATAAEAAGASP